jgi:hypothetical protein
MSPEVARFVENVRPELNVGEEKHLPAPSGHISPRSGDLGPEAVSLSTDPASSKKETGDHPWISPIGKSSAQPASDMSAQAPLVSSVGSIPLNLSKPKKIQSLNDQLTRPAQQSLSKCSDLAGEPPETGRTGVSTISTSGKTRPQKIPKSELLRYKIVLIGSSGAGKSHLIRQASKPPHY